MADYIPPVIDHAALKEPKKWTFIKPKERTATLAHHTKGSGGKIQEERDAYHDAWLKG